MEKQFTATTYIIDADKTLLIFHRKLQKWLPPGGHIDPNETPPDAARREVFEETGLEIAFIEQENIWVDQWNAKSFERPYMCMLAHVPTYGSQPAHLHMDLVYLARPTGGKLTQNVEECHDIRWFSLEDVEALKSEEEIFEETKQVIRKLLTDSFCHV